MKLRVLKNARTRPQYNLALEECLCRWTEGQGFFMLWRNDPAVIIGRFQDARAEVDAAFAKARRIPVARRNSGGGAVYHDLGNVNYSFIVPDEGGERSFARFARPVVQALTALGLEVECALSRNDITADGRKISGMAQYRHGGVLLCHGTLLFDCDLEVLARVLSVSGEKLRRNGVKSIRSRVMNLKPLLPRVADTEAFMALLGENLQESLRGQFCVEPFTLSPQDEREVQKLMEEKYLSPAWNEKGLEAGREI